MDYQSELKRLQEGSDYWKPKGGQFKVKALSELEDTEDFVKLNKEGKEERSPQAKLKISVGGENKTWTFGKGKTPASTFGQLIELAIRHGNKLTGVDFSVVVKNDGTKNDYTIVN
jgi:DNA-binding protein H-NS